MEHVVAVAHVGDLESLQPAELLPERQQVGQRLAVFRPYQVTPALLAGARDEAVFMHCLPAHRGEEVTAEVIDGPRSIVWEQAENRLHTQKALLLQLLG